MPGHVIERRVYGTRFREVRGSNGRQRWATAVTYNRVDDFGTLWLPACFNQGLDERMPTILYGHDWFNLEHVLGTGIDYKDTPSGVDVLIEFADPKQVPNAGLAMSLTTGPNPVLKDVSVGFDRQEWLCKDDLTPDQLKLGAEEAMVRADMDELSIVVRGAVPGAALRGKRSFVTKDQRGRVLKVQRGSSERAALKARLDAGRITRSAYLFEVDVLDAIDLAERSARNKNRRDPELDRLRSVAVSRQPTPPRRSTATRVSPARPADKRVVVDIADQLRRSW